MNLPSAKELAKLAAACRKAGITSFKGGGIEFTLSEATPLPRASKKSYQEAIEAPAPASEELSYDQLLNWSLNNVDPEEKSDE